MLRRSVWSAGSSSLKSAAKGRFSTGNWRCEQRARARPASKWQFTQPLRPEVERGVQTGYGEETEVIFCVTQAPRIRGTGQFGEKAGVPGAFVQEVLDGAFEHLVVAW